MKSKKPGRTKAFEREPTEDFGKCTPGNQDGLTEQCLGVKREWLHSEIPLNHLPQINQERVLQALHDLELLEDISHFVALHTLLLVHVLHRVHLLGVILLHNADLRAQTRGESGQGVDRARPRETGQDVLNSTARRPPHLQIL